jgi:lipocalin
MIKPGLTLIASTLLVTSCSHHAPMATVDYVDLDRFMGDWYVVANIPTFLEKDAHNAVETYRMNSDGTIATTFLFRNVSLKTLPQMRPGECALSGLSRPTIESYIWIKTIQKQ